MVDNLLEVIEFFKNENNKHASVPARSACLLLDKEHSCLIHIRSNELFEFKCVKFCSTYLK